jgi:Ser-tRNA(Ala) deacylase AlaX
MDELLLNEHNKDEFPPAHTAEHLLNQTMIRLFGCGRSTNAHIERKKSKMTFQLDHKPSRQEEKQIEREMQRLIDEDLPVTFHFVSRAELEGMVFDAEQGSPESRISLDRLPADASETIRLVRIGHFDVCPCIGKHVRSTAQIGRFEMLGTNWDNDRMAFRIRYKIV